MRLLVSDSGHRENWSPWNQKLILCLHQSRQALPKPWLWECTAKGTVPSDGLVAVRSDARNRGCGRVSALKLWSPGGPQDTIPGYLLCINSQPLGSISYLTPATPTSTGSVWIVTDSHGGYLLSLPRCTSHTSLFLPWDFSDGKVRDNRATC